MSICFVFQNDRMMMTANETLNIFVRKAVQSLPEFEQTEE